VPGEAVVHTVGVAVGEEEGGGRGVEARHDR
jgi:hypothetical protein